MASLEDMKNLLLGESTDLHAFYSKGILEATVVRTIRNIETIGEKLHSKTVVKRLVKATKAISHLLSKQHISHSSARGEPKVVLVHNLKLLNLK